MIPEIQRRIDDLDPHAIVLGLGPSAKTFPHLHLKPHVRVYGVNDIDKITPVHDLVIIDPPLRALAPDTPRHQTIRRANPERLWLWLPNWQAWLLYLPPRLHHKLRRIDLEVIEPESISPLSTPPRLNTRPYHHTSVSPACSTTLAWHQGARRIGLLGVDLIPGNHHLDELRDQVSWFFSHLAKQAQRLHGRIENLSPISHVSFRCPLPEHQKRPPQPAAKKIFPRVFQA